MKFICLIFFCSILTVQSFGQQRNTISLKPLNEKEVVKYSTPEATLIFTRQDLFSAFEISTPNADKEIAAINFLKKSSKKISLSETNTKASENEQLLTKIIQNKLAVVLFLRSQVQVIRSSDKKNQETIFYEIESTPEGNAFHFLFNDGRPFFTAYTKPQKLQTVSFSREVGVSEEVVFDEPVQIVNTDENQIFTIVEESPVPIGGMTAYYEYLSKNLKYPSAAKKEKLEGTSFVGFVVQMDGSLTDLSTIKGLSPECDMEAIRLIKEGPKWTAGKQNGKLRKVRFVLPVKFKLDAVK